jgi:hypothetical protein
MPNRMSEDMSDRMPEDLPVRKCINVMVGITRSKVIFFKSGVNPHGFTLIYTFVDFWGMGWHRQQLLVLCLFEWNRTSQVGVQAGVHAHNFLEKWKGDRWKLRN